MGKELGYRDPVKLNGIPWLMTRFSNGIPLPKFGSGCLTGFGIMSWNSCGYPTGLGSRLARSRKAERDPVVKLW